ncbi:MAG TPA: chloride channel protein [Candidatus Bathyarchaeia archaeon]|nr:chloride channel protein [Candidatus Bathyarchaeia archaeon]
MAGTKEAEGARQRRTESRSGVAIGEREPKIRQIVFIALITSAFALAWFASLGFLNSAVWKNDFVTANRWTIPLLVLLFSFLVGLCGKYLRAPNVIRGGMQEEIKSGGLGLDYSTFPGALLTSFFSLLSGASVGPEGPLTTLVTYIAGWIGSKLKIGEQKRVGFVMAGLSSALNGLIGNPLFTAVLATELQEGEKEGLVRFLAWNLVAGAIGYFFFALVAFPAFASSIPFTPVTALTIWYAIDAVVFGVIGAFVALFIGVSFQIFGRATDRAFKDRFMVRVMVAGVIIAIVGYFLPDLLFSGEAEIHAIIANPAAYGVLMLLAFAVLKAFLLAFSFKSGYLGGPIFPTLFSATMVALALSLLFPSVPIALLFTCIAAATIALVLSAPLAAILLTVTIATSNAYELGYISLATATALVIGAAFRQRMAQRAARKGGAMESSSA